MTTEIHFDRLLTLADYLETVVVPGLSGKGFDLGHWGNSCGTVACAVGHACDIPAFQALGLRLQFDEEDAFPVFDGVWSWGAVARFFGVLSHEQMHHLFSHDAYLMGCLTTAAEVAARIRQFVAQHQPSVAEMPLPAQVLSGELVLPAANDALPLRNQLPEAV